MEMKLEGLGMGNEPKKLENREEAEKNTLIFFNEVLTVASKYYVENEGINEDDIRLLKALANLANQLGSKEVIKEVRE